MILSVRRLVQKIKVIVKPALKVQVLLPPLLEESGLMNKHIVKHIVILLSRANVSFLVHWRLGDWFGWY
jgi:hypothetical protein